ncbi:MAG: sodium:solute symporter [Pirellulales bacterium]
MRFGRTFFVVLAILIMLGAMTAPGALASIDATLPVAVAEASSPVPDEANVGDNTTTVPAKKKITLLDWVIIAGYFAILFGLAQWVIRKNKETSDDYFLAGRGLGWFVVGASIFASNIGSEHLVGLAGSGCTDGVAMAHYELHAWCLLVLGWMLVPFYTLANVFTMPQFLEKRFSPAARWVLSIISLVAYIVTKIAVGIFAGGIVFSVLLPEMNVDLGFAVLDSFWIGSILVLIFTGVYTTLGGLRAVAYTEALQTIILIVGSALVTYFGLRAIGGWGELKTLIGSDMFNLWKPLVPAGVEGTWAPVEIVEQGKVVRQAWYFNGDYPWLGMLFCAPIIGLWYWCTDQYIVQRVLGASSEREARRGSIWASMLKLLPVFIFIVPGMICFGVMIKAERGEVDNVNLNDIFRPQAEAADGTPMAPPMVATVDETIEQTRTRLNAQLKDAKQSDGGKAFPLMVREILPPGIRGIVVAGLLAALMSSLAGVFNACSTLFTMDLYIKFKPAASEHQLVKVGRTATVIMVLIGIAWIPVIRGSEGLYHYLQSVQGYLAPPIFVVFFLGIFWKRLNAQGCLAALIVGFALGVFRLAIDTPSKIDASFHYAEGSLFWIINKVYFQYYSLVIFVISSLVMIAVSYATEAPSLEQIKGLTYGTVSDEEKATSQNSWNWADVAASAAVLIAILAAYLYFRG